MQAIKLNSRVITILRIVSSVIGLILMADWQSIPYDPCTEFSLYHHPELASGVSNTSLPLCTTVLPGCPWMNDSLRHNITAVMTSEEEVTMSLQHTEPLSPRHPEPNCVQFCYEYLLCHACPPICRSVDRTLNFVQFMVGVVIFRISIPIPDIGIMMVISDVVGRQYQGLASTGVFRSISPIFVGAAYEGVKKRTFLAMSIMTSLQIPLILILLLLYRKLGRMKEKLQAQLGSAAVPVSSESSTSEREPSLSDEEDTTEKTELLNVEEKCS